MKIITPGHPKRGQHRAKCPHCGAVFEFDDRDVKKEIQELPKLVAAGSPKNRITRSLVVRCPQEGCGLEVRVQVP